jgi:hypothetical protein
MFPQNYVRYLVKELAIDLSFFKKDPTEQSKMSVITELYFEED